MAGRWGLFKVFLKGNKAGIGNDAKVGMVSAAGLGKTIWPDRNYENFAKETYLKNVIAFRAIDEVAKAVASVPWKFFRRTEDGKNREEVTGEAFSELLRRANPSESFSFFILRVISYLVMCGNAFVERVTIETGPNKGQVRELYVLRPDRFTFETSNGSLSKYIYKVGADKKVWDVDMLTGQADVLHLKTFHPLNDWWGAAATESAAREIDTSNAAVEWNKSILDQQGRPGMIFTLVGNISPKTFDELERKLAERSGPYGAGKDLIITGEKGTTAQPYGWSPTDMDFSEGEHRLMRKTAIAYGVPPMILGILGEATFANYKEARLSFWETTVSWWLNYIRGEFNNWLFPKGSDLFVDYVLDNVPALSIKRDALWERAQKSDFLRLNEKREMVGLESLGPVGDVVLIDSTKLPLGTSEETEGETEKSMRARLAAEGYTKEEIDEIIDSDYE